MGKCVRREKKDNFESTKRSPGAPTCTDSNTVTVMFTYHRSGHDQPCTTCSFLCSVTARAVRNLPPAYSTTTDDFYIFAYALYEVTGYFPKRFSLILSSFNVHRYTGCKSAARRTLFTHGIDRKSTRIGTDLQVGSIDSRWATYLLSSSTVWLNVSKILQTNTITTLSVRTSVYRRNTMLVKTWIVSRCQKNIVFQNTRDMF